jgi:hypothetical protein
MRFYYNYRNGNYFLPKNDLSGLKIFKKDKKTTHSILKANKIKATAITAQSMYDMESSL